MPDIRRTFEKGVMNLDANNRTLPQGEYREALNMEVDAKRGVALKALSNKRLTNLSFGTNPRCLGVFEDEFRNKLYVLVLSDKGSYLYEYDIATGTSAFVLQDLRPIGERVFDLREDYPCTGMNKIISDDINKELLLMTDNNMPPLCINIERAKGYAVNGFEKEDIYLIKKPPRFAPTADLTYAGGEENDIQEQFFSFSYRYKYLDGEYSALSDFSQYPFNPGPFELDYQTGENLGFVNQFNAIRIGFNTGDKRVTDIQLVFKKSNSNNLYIIETFNKESEGWDNDAEKTFTFSNNKLYQVLPVRELYRAFDNVPHKAKAQTVIGNKVLFGNYVEGYNMTDAYGRKVKPQYSLSLISNDLSGDNIEYVLPTPGSITLGDTILRIDLTGVELIQGARISFYISMQAMSDTSVLSGSFKETFDFILLQDYANAGELAQDTDFIYFVEEIMTASFINGYTFTPPADSTLTSTSNFTIAYTTDTIDIIALEQVYTVDDTPGNPDDNPANTHEEVYEWRFFNDCRITYRSFGVASSAKTNRSYEIGLVYEDEFGRCSTVQTSKNNTIYIPQSLSTSQNKIKMTLDSLPPAWADRYKIVVKAAPLQYNNIYAVNIYQENVFLWIQLDGANKDKVAAGDTLILKADGAGPRAEIFKVRVIEVKTQERDFLEENASDAGVLIIEQPGIYMKVKADGINLNSNGDNFFTYTDSVISNEVILGPADTAGNGVGTLVGYYDADTTSFVDLPINGGTNITITYIYYSNIAGVEDVIYPQEKTAQATYPNFEDWYEAEASDLGSYNDLFNVTFTREANNALYMHVTAPGLPLTQLAVTIQVTRTDSLLIFETEPKQADVEIYYETGQAEEITGGYHTGNLQNQSATQPAIVELDFYNCFVMGNGAECYQVKDSLLKPYLNIDNRPTSTSIEEYKQVRRIADITYSEPYIEDQNINGLNVFNLSTANFKNTDKQYGSIQKMYSRDTNVVLMKEKMDSYVLFEKDAVYTAGGNTALTSVPGILGQEIFYRGPGGIGTNPESFAIDKSGRIYHSNANNGTFIRLSLDGLEEIVYGMSDYFRDLFRERPNAKVLGGYDPFKNQYVTSIGDEPVRVPQFQCGSTFIKDAQTEAFSYEFVLNDLGGDVTISYNITSGTATIAAVFNGSSHVASNVTGAGTLTFERDSLIENEVVVTVTPVTASISYSLTNTCPTGSELTIVSLVLNDSLDTGETMTDRYRWDTSPFYSTDELFEAPPVTRFESQTGVEGVGAFPSNGSLVTLQAFRDSLNTGNFDTTECNRLGYLITETVYAEADYQTILDHPDTVFVSITTTGGGGEPTATSAGSFVFSRTTADEILYLIWDYTSRNPVISDDSANCTLGESVIINVLDNDDVSVDAVVTVATQPAHGTAVANVDGTITYTHDGSENFADSFTYTVTDGGCSSTATVNITIGITCGGTLTTSGGTGIYEVSLNLGSDTGYCGIQYDAEGVPDRFQLIWDGNVVADSKYVGDNILPGPPTSYAGLLGEKTLSVYSYNGSVFIDTGEDETFTIVQDDIANNTTEPTDGNGWLIFNKATALPATVTLRVIGPIGTTGWSIDNLVCPTNELAEATEMFVWGPFAEADKGLATRSIKVFKDDLLDKFYTNILGSDNFTMYDVDATLAYINDGTNWWQISATGDIISTGTLP